MELFPVKSYLEYLFKARHYKGHGIHSPFMFELVSDVLFDRHPYYAFDEIRRYREKLKNSHQVIEVKDHGAGSHKLKSNIRKVSDIYRSSAIKKKYGEILFRLITRYKNKNIVELGTSLGVSTMYLALTGNSNIVYTIEGCPETAAVARAGFKNSGLKNVNLINKTFEDALPEIFKEIDTIDLLFVDGHHKKDATLRYFEMCKQKAGNDSIFVFDDIHWSKGMEEAWEIIRNDDAVTISADLYQLGLIFFRKECQKQHYIIRY